MPAPRETPPAPDAAAPVMVSVVIVSRDRPESLVWCLGAIDGLHHDAFEVIVVSCPAGAAALRAAGFAGRVKLVAFDEANISAARNLGIAQAAGEVVAFIDDDAAAEPMWLARLVAPFATPNVAAAGGFVRGRNGISFQWKARSVDGCARTAPLDIADAPWDCPDPGPGRAVKTEGTNMAVRRDILDAMGGFDPGFRFYLDETDLNIRLAERGLVTAIAPRAEVHHAYAASSRRRANRAVTDLSDIGASAMYFLRKHCAADERAARLSQLLREQQMRVFDQLRAGLLRKAEVGPLIEGLKRGVAEGQTRMPPDPAPLGPPKSGFLHFEPARRGGAILAGHFWQARRLRAEARRCAADGQNVSLFLFTPSPRYHKVRFTDGCYWEQFGGICGRSDRNAPLFQATGLRGRLKREIARVAEARGLEGMEQGISKHIQSEDT